MAKAKRGRTALSASDVRKLHTKQKPKPRFVSKAHVQEKTEDVLAFEDIRRVLERAASAEKRKRG